MTEAQTHVSIIDKRLLASGWDVTDHTKVIQEYQLKNDSSIEETLPNYNTSQFSDYVLLGRNGKPLAVVETKKSSKDAELGREQAKQYCENIRNEQEIMLPFCFYTNGHDIFFWDIGNYPPRKIYSPPMSGELSKLMI